MKSLLFFLIILFFTACGFDENSTIKSEYKIIDLSFSAIDLSDSNIQKFPFLKTYNTENEKLRNEYEKEYQADLRLPDEFPEIKVKIASNININNEIYQIAHISGGYGQYCSNNGCTVVVYKNNILSESFATGGFLPKTLRCQNVEYILSGSGAGTKPSSGIIRNLSDNEIKHVHLSKPLNAQKICENLKGE